MTDDLTVRRAGAHDFPGILELAKRALGWTDDDDSFLRWKHLENPFGASSMWVATTPGDDRIVGLRAFLRWELVAPDGRVVRAARAVDAATDPDFQGRGIFNRLTLEAIAALPNEGVRLIFNTPNEKSLRGSLKLGWTRVGRLAVSVMPTSWRFPAVVATARQPAGRRPLAATAGESPTEVFGTVAPLLDGLPRARGLATRRTPEFLAWRYGFEQLCYRVVLRNPSTPEAGLAVFRRRRRGRAVEAVLCEVIAPHRDEEAARDLTRDVARVAEADYLVRVDPRPVTRDPFVRLPRVGPVLACRPLDAEPAPVLSAWALTMGDVELL